MKDLLEYAQRRLDEACKGVEDTCSIRYWVGYIDGAREAQRRCNKLEDAYEAMYRDLHARTKQLERVTQELNELKGASKLPTKKPPISLILRLPEKPFCLMRWTALCVWRW